MDVFIGTICSFGFNFAPRGWATCQGQLLAISSNTALFSLLGTQYGGNGTSNFGLPDLQGRNAIHQGTGQSTYVMGQAGGQESVTLVGTNLPSHTHSVSLALSANNRSSSVSDPTNNFPAPASAGGSPVNTFTSSGGGFFAGNPAIVIGSTGNNIPISNESPFLVTNYCIALQGIFPSRS